MQTAGAQCCIGILETVSRTQKAQQYGKRYTFVWRSPPGLKQKLSPASLCLPVFPVDHSFSDHMETSCHPRFLYCKNASLSIWSTRSWNSYTKSSSDLVLGRIGMKDADAVRDLDQLSTRRFPSQGL